MIFRETCIFNSMGLLRLKLHNPPDVKRSYRDDSDGKTEHFSIEYIHLYQEEVATEKNISYLYSKTQ